MTNNNLKEQLPHLPQSRVTELETITDRITATQKAEIIVLFGSYARGDYKEKRGEKQGKKSDYDILIVTDTWEKRQELQEEVRELFGDIEIPIQTIVEDIDFINGNLEEKQYFFTDIKREGKILFDSGKCELSDSMELTQAKRVEIAEADFKMWFSEAQESWEEGKNAIQRESFKRASFHIQQTVEMCYTAIEMVFTHYNPYEHNLLYLRERVTLFDQRIKEALPYETKEQMKLFDYLNFAYIGGRYRSEEEFPVTKEQLDYWSSETKKLLALTEVICLEQIAGLRKLVE